MDISVIVPVYKGQKYIAIIQRMVSQNVEFASRQGHSLEVELLFVNDYPDEKLVLGEIDNKYKVAVIANERNEGIHQSRVNGLKKARGTYILFLDQDDEITPNCLCSQFMAIGNHDVVVGNGYRGIKGKYRKIYRSENKQQLSCKEIVFLKAANQIVSPGHCLIRKSAIPTEWYDNIIIDNGGDDLFLWLLMFENNRTFCINNDCVYKHVETGVNLSGDLGAMYRSSDNLIRIAKESGVLNTQSISIYKRRIDFLKAIQNASSVKRLLICIRNADICIAKIYAYFR